MAREAELFKTEQKCPNIFGNELENYLDLGKYAIKEFVWNLCGL